MAAFLRVVTPQDLKKREKTEGVSGVVLARLLRQALELRWERCLDLVIDSSQHHESCQARSRQTSLMACTVQIKVVSLWQNWKPLVSS